MSHKPRHRRPVPQRDFRRREPAGQQVSEPSAPARPAPFITRTVAATPARTVAPAQPAVDYRAIKQELRRIAVIAGSMFVILIILSFFLR